MYETALFPGAGVSVCLLQGCLKLLGLLRKPNSVGLCTAAAAPKLTHLFGGVEVCLCHIGCLNKAAHVEHARSDLSMVPLSCFPCRGRNELAAFHLLEHQSGPSPSHFALSAATVGRSDGGGVERRGGSVKGEG